MSFYLLTNQTSVASSLFTFFFSIGNKLHDFECNLVLISTKKFFKDNKTA